MVTSCVLGARNQSPHKNDNNNKTGNTNPAPCTKVSQQHTTNSEESMKSAVVQINVAQVVAAVKTGRPARKNRRQYKAAGVCPVQSG